MSKDFYNILGVDKGASQDEIKKAFRKKAHQYHPDKQTGDEAKFKEANEAYQTLKDQQKRAQYDQFGSAGMGGAGFGGQSGGFGGFGGGGYQDANINMDDLGDMFGDMFGFGGGRTRRRGPQKGEDIEAVFSISFNDAVFGIEKEISLRKNIVCVVCGGNGAKPGAKVDTCKTCNGHGKVRKIQRTILGSMEVEAVCSDCNGEGKTYSEKCSNCRGAGIENKSVKLTVKIPAGINNGETIRLTGQGEAGEKGASAGDLYLRIRVELSREFKREGYNIITKKEISFTDATLGASIEINTIHGEIKLKIPEGTQSGTVFNLKGKGVKELNRSGNGNHLVEIIVMTPKKLNKKQREILKTLNI